MDDGNTAYTVITAPASSAEANYNTLNAADGSVSNTDDGTAGITAAVQQDLEGILKLTNELLELARSPQSLDPVQIRRAEGKAPEPPRIQLANR